MTTEKIRQEMGRLNRPPAIGEKPSGIGTVRFAVHCPLGANDVLCSVKTVLEIIDSRSFGHWPDEAIWTELLPDWFLEACSVSMTTEEAARWLKWWQRLSPEEQNEAEISKDWSLENWLYWMEPDNRQWTLWDAQVFPDCDHLIVAVEVECWPFPWGALRWLFKAAGASAMEAEG